jgi:glycosyltransferase involved in cell wall biosynthesis
LKKLALVTTHPIQYNAPLFQLLAQDLQVNLKVFYTWSQSKEVVKDKIFGRDIKWDIPLLEGYEFEFVENVATQPGSHHFKGIDNPKLVEMLQSFQPDAILVFGWKFKSHLKVLRHFHGKIPIWFRGDSTLLDERKGYKTTLRRGLLTWVYRYVDKAIYVGKANKLYFLKHGLKESQLIYAPHAIDNNRFNDVDNHENYEKLAQDWREKLGYQPTDIVVLFAGKFEPKKQPGLLASALLNTNKIRKQKLHLLFLGSGPLESELKQKYSSEPYIKFLPFQNQSKMPVVYRLGDVFCLPSNSDTWGLAINESLASGTPAIVSNKVGCALDLVDDIHVMGFKYNSLNDLEKILMSLDKQKLNDLGKSTKKYIEFWNYSSIVDAITIELQK